MSIPGHKLEVLRDPWRNLGAVLCSCGQHARTFDLHLPGCQELAQDAVLSAHGPRQGPPAAEVREEISFAPAEAMDQMRLRARHSLLLRTILGAQPFVGCDDATIAALAACYLSDALESTTEKYRTAKAREIVDPIETISDGKTVRHAFLPNAAREMYEALKALDKAWSKDHHDPESLHSQRIFSRDTIQLWRAARAAIAKAEGR